MAGELTQAAGPVGSSSLYDPRTSLYVQDDFISGVNTNGQGGSLGWSQAGTVTGVASETNRPGIVRLDTGSSSGTQARINVAQMSATSAAVAPTSLSRVRWMTRLNTNDTDTAVRLGLANSVAGTPGNDGIFFEKGAADTIWQCITRASSSQTKTASAVTIDTNFHTFSIQRSGASIFFYIDYVLVATHTATIPTVFLAPMAQILNSANASKTLDVDYFELQLTGLVR